MFSDNTKHGAISLASLALLGTLIMPKAYGTNKIQDISPPPSTPPAAGQVETQDTENVKLPDLENLEFHNEANLYSAAPLLASSPVYEIAVTKERKPEQANTEQSVVENSATDSHSFMGWAVAGALATWKICQQVIIQARTRLSKFILDKGEKYVSKFKGKPLAEDLSALPVSINLVEVKKSGDITKIIETPKPFKPDTLGELLTNPKHFQILKTAIGKCEANGDLPFIKFESGEKENTYKGLPAVNEAIWETVSTYFTDRKSDLLKPKAVGDKINYLIIPVIKVSQDPTEGKSLTLSLITESDLRKCSSAEASAGDEIALRTLKAALSAYISRLESFPNSPLFKTCAT